MKPVKLFTPMGDLIVVMAEHVAAVEQFQPTPQYTGPDRCLVRFVGGYGIEVEGAPETVVKKLLLGA